MTAPRLLPLGEPAQIGKTGTKLEDLSRSVQVVSRELLDEQGALRLTDGLSNVSSASQGGQFAFGFYDRVILRGLNATYLTDGLPDSISELGGIPHSLTGVERIEVMKGPGSALYGTSAQGGMINLVHYRPSNTLSGGGSVQFGSFDTLQIQGFITGPTGLQGTDYRVDASYTDSDGFRGTHNRFVEFLPAISFKSGDHEIQARLEIRDLNVRPDAIGIPFSPPAGTGRPADVEVRNRYYSPFARGNQNIQRVLLSDAWDVSAGVTINNRVSYTHRDVDVLRNAGGTVASLSGTFGLRGRQIRRQRDESDDILYQIEPVFRFATGGLKHNLLTGFQAQIVDGHVTRSTADLPNIASIAAPVLPETSEPALTFRCDATHSCADADLDARFYSLYAVDQIDLSHALKLRLSIRNDWDKTRGVATSDIPSNPGMQQPCDPPRVGRCPWVRGVPVRWKDSLLSWDVGAVYFLSKQFSLFAGAQNARYPIFNTEEPQSVGQVAEGGKQMEGGARLALRSTLTLTGAAFQVKRSNVFTIFADPATGFDVPTVFSYRVRGIEADLQANPLSGWFVTANASKQKPVISDFPQTPANVGRLVPSDPEWLANLWTDYDFTLPGDAGTLRVNAGVRYRGRSFADAGNTRILPHSTIFSAGISLVQRRFEVSFGVKNLSDQLEWVGGAGAGGGAIPGPGRTFFGRAAARF